MPTTPTNPKGKPRRFRLELLYFVALIIFVESGRMVWNRTIADAAVIACIGAGIALVVYINISTNSSISRRTPTLLLMLLPAWIGTSMVSIAALFFTADLVYRLKSSFGISYDFVFTIDDNEIRNIHRRMSALLWGAGYAYVPAIVMFDYPLIDDKEWDWSGERIEKGRVVEAVLHGAVAGEETIKIGEVVYECLVVSIVYSDENANREELRMWLAPGVGMVRGTMTIEGSGVLSLISRIIGSELHLNLLGCTVL